MVVLIKEKKGITPLMATLLLISFAVAVGVVFMNVARAQVEDGAQCAVDVGMKLANIAGSGDFCYDTAKQELKFTIENGVNQNIEGLIVNVIGTEKAETFELNDAKVIKAGTYVGHVKYNLAAAGTIRQVKISPKVVLYDEELICSEFAVVVESVSNC